MTSVQPPNDLRAALEKLAMDQDPAPELFERVARWRRACGDAEAAALWQTWSLLSPEPPELQLALAPIFRELGDTSRAGQLLSEASTSEDDHAWQRLALLLQQGDLEAAVDLQSKLLASPPQLALADLLLILQHWRDHQRHTQALLLLEALVQAMQQRGDQPSAKVCSAMADLLEQQQRFDEAEPWWQRTHQLQPQMAWPLMRLGHQALRRENPAVAFHYAGQALNRDPAHAYAPRLQRKALEAMGATRSLALLDGSQPDPQTTAAGPITDPPAEEVWSNVRQLALVGFRDASILSGWIASLQSDPNHSAMPVQGSSPRKLWLIASPEPLWLHHQARQLLEQLSDPVAIEAWPEWDEQRHGSIPLVLESSSQRPGWRRRTNRP